MMTGQTAYRSALAIAVGTALFLVLGIGALGVVAADGDRADMMFLGVLAIGIGGAVLSRLRPQGMARTMFATAAATLVVGWIAIASGKHEADGSSVLEISPSPRCTHRSSPLPAGCSASRPSGASPPRRDRRHVRTGQITLRADRLHPCGGRRRHPTAVQRSP